MTSRSIRMGITNLLAGVTLLAAPLQGFAQIPLPPPAQTAPAGTLELLLDQGRRLFDSFQYDQAVPLFDRLIITLAPGGQVQRPDLLVPALELRARSRFALGDTQGAEQDFSSLLAINPAHKLGAGISPRVVRVFDDVRKLVVGQAVLSLTPAGDVQIDGRTVSLRPEPQPIDLAAGEHQITATRQGYRAIDQKLTVAPGASASLDLTLERISATLTFSSVPAGVEVLLNGASKGTTTPGASATGPSTPFVLADLATGAYRLQLRRSCYQEIERAVSIDRPEDLRLEALRLTPAVAAVRVQSTEPGAAVFVDGAARGNAPVDLADLCAGEHLIEVRGARGRFIDRREWKTGDNVTLAGTLRPAFAVVSTTGITPDLRAEIERSFAAAKGLLIYVPPDVDLDAALRGENVPANWLDPSSTSSPRLSKDLVRDISRRLSTKLSTQGVAGIVMSADRNEVSVAVLAASSGEPDIVTFSLADPTSRARAVERLSAPLPPVLRPSIQASVVDVDGVSGATVVRVAGSGLQAGLVVGDVIVAAGGAPVASVRDLQTKIDGLRAGALDLPLDVKTSAGTTKSVTGATTLVADTLPLRDGALPYNRALSDLQEAVRTATGALDKAAARLNLAVAHMRLGNWADAEAELRAAQLPDGPGVSAGTVDYLLGLCLESAGKIADSRAAFTRAADATEARLSYDGPLVAPLAKQKIGR